MHDVLPRCIWLILALLMTFPTAPSYAVEKNPLVLTGPADVEALSHHFEYITDPA